MHHDNKGNDAGLSISHLDDTGHDMGPHAVA